MMKNPETYEELIRFKKCVDLTKYYELSQDEVEKIYNYLSSNPVASIIGNKTGLVLNQVDQLQPQEIINAKCIDNNIDGVKLTNDLLSLIPHYVPGSSRGGYRGRSGYTRSSNNNNNNNNNNNR